MNLGSWPPKKVLILSVIYVVSWVAVALTYLFVMYRSVQANWPVGAGAVSIPGVPELMVIGLSALVLFLGAWGIARRRNSQR